MYLQRDRFVAMVALCLHTVMRAPTGSAPQKYNSACFNIMFLPQFSFYCTVLCALFYIKRQVAEVD